MMLLHINRLHHSVNITFICTGKPENSWDSLYCAIGFIGVVPNQTHSISEVCLYVLFAKLLCCVQESQGCGGTEGQGSKRSSQISSAFEKSGVSYDTNEPIYETGTDSQTQRTDLGLPGGRGWVRRMDWEFGISRCKLLYQLYFKK